MKIEEIFKGYFDKDKKNGFGVEYKEQSIYFGYFTDDFKDGHGYILSPDYTTKQEVEFQKGSLFKHYELIYLNKSNNINRIKKEYHLK